MVETKTSKQRVADEALEKAGERMDIDAEAIRSQAESVLSQDMYWFPVRHHSPAVSRHLRAVIGKRKPKMIFMEGPSEATGLIQYIVDSKTKPPIAIYSSYRDDDNVLGLAGIMSAAENIPARFSAWYPMLGYSPEYVAFQTAHTSGAEVVLMDLPHHALLKKHGTVPGFLDPTTLPGDKPEMPTAPGKIENKVGTGTDQLISESSFYQKLAAAAGFRTWDEAWDSLFEIQEFDGNPELFRREFGVFCAAVRATANKAATATDGTLERERFMMQTIRKTMEERSLTPDECMVVCGGFHLFLDQDDTMPPPKAPPGTVYTSVVPYSFFRVSELSGYRAGNRAPQFYQTMWDLHLKKRDDELLVEHVVTVLKKARREGEHVSSADAISTCQQAELLSRLRGRHRPTLDDIHDALITCCCKGDPKEDGLHLLKAIDAADIGSKIGRVTESMGRLPIVQDFYAQVDRLKLEEVINNEKRVTLVLDRRDEFANSQSVFLHRCVFMGIPVAAQTDVSSGEVPSGTLFKETWALRWSPDIEATLVERSLYGDTIESAALARLRERLALEELNAGKISSMLLNAANMDLPNLVQEVEDSLAYAIDNDTRFVSLAQAITNLSVIERYAAYRNLRRGVVDKLLERAYDRACFAVVDIVAVPEEQQPAVVSGLMSIAEMILRGDRPDLDRNLFIEHVRSAAATTEIQFLRGVMLGILTELRVHSTVDLARELSALANAAPEVMIKAGDFLDGIMAASRTSILLGAAPLIVALDDLLRAAEWEPFLVMLPRMRAAFERLHESQRDSLAQSVAQKYGLEESESLQELQTSVGAAAFIARIDLKVAKIMDGWDFK